MITPCSKQDKNQLIDLLKTHPDLDLYLLSDLYMYEIGKEIEAWKITDSFGTSVVILLRKNMVISYDAPLKHLTEILEIIASKQRVGIKYINGNPALLKLLQQQLSAYSLRVLELASLSCNEFQTNQNTYPHTELCRLSSADDFVQLHRLLCSADGIDYEQIPQDEREYFVSKKRASLAYDCMALATKMDNVFVSTASISAVSPFGAMIIGVATLKAYRNRGLATYTVKQLCQVCKEAGLKKLVLYFDNPLAASVYLKIGFTIVAKYGMLSDGSSH
ncbi:MAG: GNAT family N-acetyltransferase [Atopobium sp.]|uniref:GNAT family N-acetyltransferase n=1 Tax=Atopobium sp. TaxID=1872650 RepID=UPI002A81B74F|nr:GNAT family N-acetyltransferase [Atopobium sp.]MDY4523179.1 GNAT family N-acetyltransferase [Atopobium sp.]